MFAYCLNNPVNGSDPSGHSVLGLVLGITAAVLGFASYLSLRDKQVITTARKGISEVKDKFETGVRVDSEKDKNTFLAAMAVKTVGDIFVTTGLVKGTIAATSAIPATGGLSVAPAIIFGQAFPAAIMNVVGDITTVAKGLSEYSKDGEFFVRVELPDNVIGFVDFMINGPIKIYD